MTSGGLACHDLRACPRLIVKLIRILLHVGTNFAEFRAMARVFTTQISGASSNRKSTINVRASVREGIGRRPGIASLRNSAVVAVP